MLKSALCLCFLAQLVHGQIDGYEAVEIFACDDTAKDNVPQLIIKTEESGNVSSPCYDGNRTDYTAELDAGLRLINITFDSPHLHGYELTIENFQIADSDRLYIGTDIIDAGRNSQAERDFILTSTSTTDGNIHIQRVEDGPVQQTLNWKDSSNNKLLLEVSNGYNSVFLDFYTVVDTVGGRGFLIKFAADINKCLFTDDDVWCKNGGTCTRTGVNTASCACTAFWKGDRCETDVDECADDTHNCHTNANCTNKDGGFDCECKGGYEGNGVNCTDIDECDESVNTHKCAETGTCDNTDGGYDCTCNEGYTGGVGGPCTDIDECELGDNDCDDTSRAKCIDGDGSYTCECLSGYTGNGTVCTDVDECEEGLDKCDDEGGMCTDIDGNYTCKCMLGFTGNGFDCEDINECVETDASRRHNCSSDANCENGIGNYSCECKKGYTGNGFMCEDVDECRPGGENDCAPENSTCMNEPGDFNCSCDNGFTGDGKTCSNIDECDEEASCHANADCKDNKGSFTCTCKDGFSGDGKDNCADVDECTDGTHDCNTSATCMNLEPGYSCTCDDGYTGNGRMCEDIDECASTNDCKPNSKCDNNVGNYTCPCLDGYTGNGLTACIDIDECSDSDLNNCTGPEYTCDNDPPGSFSCICDSPVYRGPANTACVYYCDHDTDCRTNYETGFLEMPRVWDGTTEYSIFKETFWNFTGKDGSNGLRLRFKAFDTEIKDDFLSVYPGNVVDIDKEIVGISGRIGNLYNEKERVTSTGNIEKPGSGVTAHLDISTNEPVFTLSTSDLLFVFTSDRRNTSTGFRLEWEYDTNDCPPENPCFNDGMCDDRAFTYQCIGCNGYKGMNCNIDIDECGSDGGHNCDENAACNNTIGSFTCACNADYTGNGANCYQFIVLDNLDVVKTVNSLEVSFDITSRWGSPEYISVFTLSISSLPDGTFEREFDINATDLVGKSFNFTGLNAFTQYNVTIGIKKTGALFGTSVLQNDVFTQIITTTELAAGVPKNFMLSNPKRDRITLSWEKPDEFGNGNTAGFGEVLHYQVCYAPTTAAEAVANIRGISLSDKCLILDDTYTGITLTMIYSYMDLAFKIRAYSSIGYGDYTTVETSFTGSTCPQWEGAARVKCDDPDDLLLQSEGFPRAITSSDNLVIEQYWSFDHSSINSWRMNVYYFDVVTQESSLDYGYGDLDITDHDIEKDNINVSFTGVLDETQGPFSKNSSVPAQDTTWFAFISDRTRKRPGFQVEIEPDVNSCDSSPCLHGGSCTDGSFSYTCDCTSTDWTGPNCEYPHIKPSATCTTGKNNVDVVFDVQNEWKKDETVIGGYTISISNPDGDSEAKMIGDTTAGFTGLSPFFTYSVTVTVVQPDAESLRDGAVRGTRSISCQTQEDVPSEPRNVTVTRKSGGFDVSWDPPAQLNGVISYKVSYKSVNHAEYDEPPAEDEGAAQTTTTFSITGLRDYRMYDITVTAMTSAGSMDTVVTDTTLPGAPAAFVSPANVTVITVSSARVEWTFVDAVYVGPVTVTVFAIPENDKLETINETSASDGLDLILGGLEEGQIYNFTLTASTGTAPVQTISVTGIDTDSIAPGMVASFDYDRDTSTFTWTAPELTDRNGKITGYRLSAVSTVLGFTTKDFDADELSFELPGLPAFTNYNFTIQAINDAGVGLKLEITILTKEAVPDTPTNVQESEKNARNITVSWEAQDPAVGETNYTVTYTDGTTSVSLNTSSTTTIILDLSPFTTYTITVVAITNAGNSDPTAEKIVETSQDKPEKVENLKAEFNIDNYEITVTWNEPAVANGDLGDYNIKWTANGTIKSDTSSALVFIIKDVILSETEYEIEVYATTGGGDGPSSQIPITTPKLLPEIPQNVTVSEIRSTSVQVNIASPSIPIIPDSYTITLSQDPSDCIKFGDKFCLSNDQSHKPTLSQIPYTITGLKSYRKYTISVAANPQGEDNASTDNIEFQTLPGAPYPVTNISTSTQPGEVNVTFTPGSPLTGPASYTIILTASNGDTLNATVAVTDVFTNITATVNGTSPNTEYTVTVVSAVGDATTSTPSNAVPNFTTSPATPTFTISPTSSDQLKIIIDAVAGATSYVVTYVETDCTGCTPINETVKTNTTTIADLKPYTTYTIKVSAVSDAGASVASELQNRTKAGTPSLINPSYQVKKEDTDDPIRSAFEVALENVCDNKVEVFNESQGAIVSVVYLVLQDGATESTNDVKFYGQVHAQQPSEQYQALTITCTSSNRRRKRKTTSDGKVVIGADNTCPGGGTTECNGPLKSSTKYTFRACGVNEENNRVCTAPSEPVTTDANPSTGLTPGEIAAIVICSILLLILIILLIVYLVRRRNSRRGKHRVSREGRENPTFDSTKPHQQQRYDVDPAAEPKTKYTSDPVA